MIVLPMRAGTRAATAVSASSALPMTASLLRGDRGRRRRLSSRPALPLALSSLNGNSLFGLVESRRYSPSLLGGQAALAPSPTACQAAAAAASARSAVATPLSHLLIAFLSGGLFFSAVIGTAVAFFALGPENFKRVLSVRQLVFKRVWGIFCLGLGAARATLRKDESWNWRDAWKVLREKLGETRRAAAEGVEAIRLEASLYAAAVGKPGLIALQYFVDHLTPKFFAAALEESLRESLSNVEDRNVKGVELTRFSVGRKCPELLDARAYELGADGMAFDIDVRWDSEMSAGMTVTASNRIAGVSIPVSVRNVRFIGVVRVVLAPLTPEPPGFGAALISLPAAPKIGLDVKMAGGEVTKMPWLRSEIMSTIQKGIEDEYLWPRRVVIPSPAPLKSSKIRTMLSPKELMELSMSDPLLRAERELANKPEYQHNHLERMHEAPQSEALRMDVLVKEENCDEEDEPCVIDEWFTEDEMARMKGKNGWRIPVDSGSWQKAFERAFDVVRNGRPVVQSIASQGQGSVET